MSSTFKDNVELKFQLYNSLFLTLPFGHIRKTGTFLPLLTEQCEIGFGNEKSPAEIIEDFFSEYFDELDSKEQNDLLFNFIQYIERQVVLFDSVEDAAYTAVHDMDGNGTVTGIFKRAEYLGVESGLQSKLNDFSLRIVLTAHPTQFYPGSVLGIITDLNHAIQKNDLPEANNFLLQLGKTPFLKKTKPTPYDEAKSLIWYLENVFYDAISDVIFKVEEKLKALGGSLNKERIIEMGFWPGGDRDGNPFVNSDITKKVAARLKRTILILYFRDIRKIKRRLTFPGVSDKILTIEKKLYDGINNEEQAYSNVDKLLDELREIRTILVDKHNGLFVKEVSEMITKVKVFGLHLAIVDVRQDSSEIEALYLKIVENLPADKKAQWNNGDNLQKIDLLLHTPASDINPECENHVQQDTYDSFGMMEEVQAKNGERSCHRYIISNSQHALHVMMAFNMARWMRKDSMDVDIVPLFETIDDLRNASEEMRILYTNDVYRKHLKARGDRQDIMLGFSDGTKDGGYLSANYSIFQAKEELTKVSRAYGIKVAFFDGRGGPPARGGGNTHKFYASLGEGIEDKEVQLTIQGQTISSNFGTKNSATFNIEQLLTAGLENTVFKGDRVGMKEEERKFLNELADISLDKYVSFKHHPKFLDYLQDMGTLPYYGATNIGSRPVKRAGGGALTLSKLRAIPFVGSWSQMKQNVPGYYGVGTALKTFKDRGELDKVKALYKHSMFFQTLIQNSMQSLSKCYFPLTAYLSNHEEYGEIWNNIHDEYQLTKALILEVTGEDILLANSPNTRASIALREKLVLPLITIQQYALKMSREHKDQAELYNKMVLRTMFGIINAGRNSA